MGESSKHAELVDDIVWWVKTKYPGHLGLSVLRDALDSPSGKKTWPIGGYFPDLIAQTSPRSFFIIGEAKSAADMGTAHTAAQLRAYLDFLTFQPEPILILATPLVMIRFAKSLIRRLQRSSQSERVPTVFLAGRYGNRVVEC